MFRLTGGLNMFLDLRQDMRAYNVSNMFCKIFLDVLASAMFL